MPSEHLQNKDPILLFLFPFQLELVSNQLFPEAIRLVIGIRTKDIIKNYFSHEIMSVSVFLLFSPRRKDVMDSLSNARIMSETTEESHTERWRHSLYQSGNFLLISCLSEQERQTHVNHTCKHYNPKEFPMVKSFGRYHANCRKLRWFCWQKKMEEHHWMEIGSTKIYYIVPSSKQMESGHYSTGQQLALNRAFFFPQSKGNWSLFLL